MTHELKKIIKAYVLANAKHKKTVLATVVALEGSSYRRPGVCMLIDEQGNMTGAVSGGCVEKEILRQAQSVFTDDLAKIMTYDGRYRLGCEGVLYILIEPFNPSIQFINAFTKVLTERVAIETTHYFKKENSSNETYGSVFNFQNTQFSLRKTDKIDKDLMAFTQKLKPTLKLVIIGAEHDAVELCSYAETTGWEVTIVAAESEEKTILNFPGARELQSVSATSFNAAIIDDNTAVVLMTHSYVKDLEYLLALKETYPLYLGLLGPTNRREKLLNEFMELYPFVADRFFDAIYGPAGLNIGAETPQEIAVSIVAEILTVIRGKKPMQLKNKSGRIHS